MQRKSGKLIVGNWKMNPSSKEEARMLAKDIKRLSKNARGADIVICPPFVYLNSVYEVLGRGRILLGGQDVFHEPAGAYTGEISGAMLKNAGVSFVIIGHSERRKLGESDETVNRKVKLALKEGLIPIICVGESDRDSHGYYLAKVKRQTEQALAGVSGNSLKNCIIAYEPVWAVGNKDFETATPHDAVEMSIFIRKTLSDMYKAKRAHEVRVIYGGSVNEKNAGEFLREKDIAGLLVGRESLTAKKFLTIASSI